MLFSPLDKLIAGAALAVLIALAAWFGWEKFTDAIRAPAEARATAAIEANGTLVKANTEIAAKAERLSDLLTEREASDAKIDQRLAGIKNDLDKLAKQNKAVQDWRATAIPDAVIELRAVQGAEGSSNGAESSVQRGQKSDQSRDAAAAVGTWSNERRPVAAITDIGIPAGPVQPEIAGRAKVPQNALDRLKERLRK